MELDCINEVLMTLYLSMSDHKESTETVYVRVVGLFVLCTGSELINYLHWL